MSGGYACGKVRADRLRTLAEENNVYIAASNQCPSQTVLSGKKENLEIVAGILAEDNIKCTFLNVSNGFHSALMDEILEPFREDFQRREIQQTFFCV